MNGLIYECVKGRRDELTAGPDVDRFPVRLLPQHLWRQVTWGPREPWNTPPTTHTSDTLISTPVRSAYMCWCVYLCLFFYVYVCGCVSVLWVRVCASVCGFFPASLRVGLFLWVCVCVCVSVCLFVFVFYLSVHPSVCLPARVHACVCVSISVSLFLPVDLYVCVCVCVCVRL